MMTVRDVYNYIDSFAPFASAAVWDNSGILIGDPDAVVSKAIVALDITAEEIAQAVKLGAQLIISHHPVIFDPLKKVDKNDPVYLLIQNGIAALCAHTNLDMAPGGVNDTLCSVLGMQYRKLPADIGEGFLNAGTFPGIVSTDDLARHISEKLHASVRYCKANETVCSAAVCSGAGGDLFRDAAAAGCNALITGDASYHDFLDAKRSGVSLFAAGHYETEIIIVNKLISELSERFPDAAFFASEREAPVTTFTQS